MAGIITNINPSTRRDIINFSIENADLSSASVKWTLYDKWLGAAETAYIPEVRSNGTLINEQVDLENYFDRTLTCVGDTFSECIFYPNGVVVEAEITYYDPLDSTLIINEEKIEMLVYPDFEDDRIIKPSSMRIYYKGIKVAPILSTHNFRAYYKGDEIDSIVASALVISEEENKTGKVIAGFDAPIEANHTWKTAGRKYLTYKIFYDDGFRLRCSIYSIDFIIPAAEIKDKDDPSCVVEQNHHHDHFGGDLPPKVYVICTRRCLSGIGNMQEYEFNTGYNQIN